MRDPPSLEQLLDIVRDAGCGPRARLDAAVLALRTGKAAPEAVMYLRDIISAKHHGKLRFRVEYRREAGRALARLYLAQRHASDRPSDGLDRAIA